MRYTILFSIFLFATLTGCKKDKFGSKPSLKFKSVNSTVLPPHQLIRFTLSFTDAEGDLSDSMFVEKTEPTCVNSNNSGTYIIPGFPVSKNEKGDLIVSFANNYNDPAYVNMAPQCSRNDTAVFRFAIKDKANHVSDTVSSPPIIIIYQ
jgi:hypothetical protein